MKTNKCQYSKLTLILDAEGNPFRGLTEQEMLASREDYRVLFRKEQKTFAAATADMVPHPQCSIHNSPVSVCAAFDGDTIAAHFLCEKCSTIFPVDEE